MSFIVTARKWRPKRFDDVVGQEHITGTLKNAIREKRIAHAYLFTGPRGVGKTTTARILAKAVNCENPKDAEPCNECFICKSIQNSQLMDIIEIDGASNRGIDEVRTLRDSVKYAPTRGKYKVYIIDEVHMLTKESFNAFLKTLEEPPEHVIFIFATTDAHKVPLTITSRCQRFDFRRIQLDKIKETLLMIAKEENINIDDTTLTIIAKKADGALRDAESYFDQVISYCQGKIEPEVVSRMLNLINEEIFFKISDAVLNKNYKAVFQVTSTIFENGWDYTDFLEGLTEHFRNILSVVITNSTGSIEAAEHFKKLYLNYADVFSESDLLRILNFLNRSYQEIKFSQNQKIKIEITLSHLIALEKTSTITDVISGLTTGNDTTSLREQKELYTAGESPVKKKDPVINHISKEVLSTSPHNQVYQKENNSVSTPEINFDDIVNKWKNFVDFIGSEKGLMLAPLLKSFNLHSYTENKLQCSTSKVEDKAIFEMHSKYIEKKSEEFFGKKLKFDFSGVETGIEKPVNTSSKTAAKNTITSDPYEIIILNELGGEKIR